MVQYGREVMIFMNNYPDYLEHHGILGQKWGVRRYQNKDGTLTKEGREKYYKIDPNSGYYKNTQDRIDKGSKIGTAIGLATGAAHIATVGMLAPYALSTAVVNAGIYAVSGYAHGVIAGGIYGAIETRKGQQYIENVIDKKG